MGIVSASEDITSDTLTDNDYDDIIKTSNDNEIISGNESYNPQNGSGEIITNQSSLTEPTMAVNVTNSVYGEDTNVTIKDISDSYFVERLGAIVTFDNRHNLIISGKVEVTWYGILQCSGSKGIVQLHLLILGEGRQRM